MILRMTTSPCGPAAAVVIVLPSMPLPKLRLPRTKMFRTATLRDWAIITPIAGGGAVTAIGRPTGGEAFDAFVAFETCPLRMTTLAGAEDFLAVAVGREVGGVDGDSGAVRAAAGTLVQLESR